MVLSTNSFADTAPVPNGSARFEGPANEGDTKIRDLTSYSSPDGMKTAVYFGVLMEGKPIADTKYQDEIQTQINNAAAGLPCSGLSLAQDGTAMYEGRSIRLIFYWYRYSPDNKLLKSGAFESSLQNTLYERFKFNLEESIRRANWTPPGYSDLAVPSPKPLYKKPTAGANSIPTEEYIDGMGRLRQHLLMLEAADPQLAQKLRSLITSTRVTPLGRVNLEGGSQPTVIYQMIQYTPNGILVSQDSFKKLPDEHQSDAMLYALLSGVLPDSPNRRAKAWKFHLSILAAEGQDGIDAARYEEAKRNFSMSGKTESMFSLLSDFETYRSSIVDKYGVDGTEAKRINGELKSLTDYLYTDAYRLLHEDYEKLFGKGPRYLPASPENDPLIRYKFRVWNSLSGAFAGTDDAPDSMDAKAAAVEKALQLIQSGKITAADLDKLTAKEQAQPMSQPKPVAAAQNQGATITPGRR